MHPTSSTASSALRHIVLDTETTGLFHKHGDRIIEIACLELVDHRPRRSLHFYINPERRCHPEANQVHGIQDAFLQDKPKFAELADEIMAFMAGATLVIHNAPFDLGFLNAEFKRLHRPPVQTCVAGVVDTLAMARSAFPAQRNNLDALCERFGIDRSERHFHGALLDAQLLSKVYQRLRTQKIEQTLEAQLNMPTAPNPLHDFMGWQKYLTSLLPSDARVEVTVTQHIAEKTPYRCSFQVRVLNITLSSMPMNTCQLNVIDVYDREAP